MVAKSLKGALAGLMVFPTAALALGLGDIHLKSTLDAPLDANIEILGATPEQMANLNPKLASRKTFVEHGLDWSPFLTHVTLRAVHLPNGRNVLEVRSTEPVTEPFLSLLVELNWQRGELLREYDVLLNPPVYTPNQSKVAHAVAPPVTGPGARQGHIERAPPAPPVTTSQPASVTAAHAPAKRASSPTGKSASSAASSTSAAPGSYDVHRGDTLSGIARQFASGDLAWRERWMLAAYDANPGAFNHNMNWLRAGAVLRLPNASQVVAVTAADAQGAVHRQYVAWRSETASSRGAKSQGAASQHAGTLRLVAPTPAAGAGSATAAANRAGSGTVKALKAQVQSLQSQLASSRRLLAVKSAQLQKLQSQLAAREGEAPAASSPPSAAAAAAAHPAPAAKAPSPARKVASVPRRPAAKRPTAADHAGPASTSSWLAEAERLWWALALALLAFLGFLGLRWRASRRQTGLDESLDRLAQEGAGGHDMAPPMSRPPIEARREPTFEPQPPGRAPEIVVEESGTHERPRLDEAAVPSAARHVEADDTVGGEAAIKLDQGDPLAEADFHMAYGLYDQAADLIRIAIEHDPQRRDLKLKLLEVFFVWGNKEQFLQTARELASSRAQAGPGEWDKIVIMGKQLAPEDPLFAEGAATSGAAAGGVDLDLEGGQNQVDFDVADSSQDHSSDVEGVDLDIGTALEERDDVAEAAAHQATDRNLALDDSLVLPDDATAEREFSTPTRRMTGMADESASSTREMTGTTREMEARASEFGGATREMTTTLEQDSWDPTELMPEAPTVERPVLPSERGSTNRQKVEMAMKAGGSEQTAELALDDLGLDIGPLHEGAETADEASLPPDRESGSDESAADAPTLLAGLDEHSRRLIETAEQRRVASADEELTVSSSGTWHFDQDPHTGGDGARAANRSSPEDDTSRLAALNGQNVDFEVGEPTQVTPKRPADGAAAGNGADTGNGAAVGSSGNGRLDLDVGDAHEPAGEFAATQRLQPDEIAIGDLEPVTMSEVGTKLDLARAYMDMGDPEGARNILEEVVGEGSAAQKQEAERLIASLPG